MITVSFAMERNPAKKLNSTDKLREFLAEAKILREVRHPNVVQFFGIFLDATQQPAVPLIIMEFMDGSLDLILQTHSFPKEQLITFVSDTLQGMVCLESKNVIHCDLAARNILVKQDGNGFKAKVGDFGMGKVSSSKVYYSKDSQMPIKVRSCCSC